MFLSKISKYSLALIKPNRPPKNNQLNIVNLNKCRSLLKLQPHNSQDLPTNIQNYMEKRISYQNQLNYHNYSTLQESLNIFETELALLQHRPSFQQLQCNYLNKVLYLWGRCILEQNKLNRNNEQKTKQKFKELLKLYFKKICNCIFLMKLDQTHIFLYFRIYDLIHYKQFSFDKEFTSLRYVYDKLLQLKKIKFTNLKYLMGFARKFDLNSVYYSKYNEILSFIYRQLPLDIYKSQEENEQIAIEKLLFQIQKAIEIPQQFVQIIPKFYDDHPNLRIKLKAFCIMMEFFIVNKDNINTKKNIGIIKMMTNGLGMLAYTQISKMFSRADIWLIQFCKNDNWKEIDIYYHYIYDDLLVNMGLGGDLLMQRALGFRNALAAKNIFINKINMKQQYRRLFGKTVNSMNSIHAHISSSMKLICTSQILNEVQIKYFAVDMLINNKHVIQINNLSHYKRINNELRPNLKSSFRQRILKLLGYKFKNICTVDYSSANYSMYKEVNEIISSIENLKLQKKKENE